MTPILTSALRTAVPALALLACVGAAGAAEAAKKPANVREAARAAIDTADDSVIALRVVAKLKLNAQGQSQDMEQKLEVVATAIEPGLAVTSASGVDPSGSMKAMLSKLGQGSALAISAEIKETALLLADGTEVEADIVLSDPELDLAFVRPRDAAVKLVPVKLAARSTPAKPLDELFLIGRTGKATNRSTIAALGMVTAWVKGPQPYYLVDEAIAAHPGCIAYGTDGAALGLVVSRKAAEESGGNQLTAMLALMGDKSALGPQRIVRPVDQILELAGQAKQAPKPEAGAEAEKPADAKPKADDEAKEPAFAP